MRFPHIFPVLLLSGPFLAGQSVLVHPKAHANLEGGCSFLYPLGFPATKYDKLHYLQVDDLRPSRDIRIKGLAFRPDGAMSRPWSPFHVELDLRLSTARRRSSLVNTWFEGNYTKDLTTVVARKTLKFPGSPGITALPAPFLFTLPFDGGKTFRLGAGKEICWDIRIYSSTTPGYPNPVYLDGVVRGKGLFARSFGKGGIHPKWGTPVRLALGDEFTGGYQAVHGSIQIGPPNGSAFVFFGPRLLKNGIPFGGWRSFFHLDPTAPLFTLGPFPDLGGTGVYLFSFLPPVGSTIPLQGRTFYAQAVIVGRTPAETCGTNALECMFTRPWYSSIPGTGRVMLSGRDALVSPTGAARIDEGVIVKYIL